MPKLTWNQKTLESFNEPARLDLYENIFPGGGAHSPNASPGKTTNRLVLGDNLKVMHSLLPEFEDRINLIYADPPFFTNKSFQARLGRGEDSRKPESWKLGEGYADHWKDLDEYLDFLYARLKLMHQLLSPTGSLYLHLDWHADAYGRLLLDEIFGREHLINQIAWLYHGPSPIRRAFNRKHDTLYLYSRSNQYTFNSDEVREPYNPSTVKTFASSRKAGFGKVPDLARGKVPEDWWYFPVVARLHNERSGYPTQKPEALLERIIRASSNPGDLVADFFCGSGTTLLMADRLGRNYLGADSTWRAIHTTRTRLVSGSTSPFQVWKESAIQIPTNQYPLQASVNGDTLTLSTAVELDYWEADENWNGRIFTSTLQVMRHIKTGEIPLTAQINRKRKTILLRAVTTSGELLELEIPGSI